MAVYRDEPSLNEGYGFFLKSDGQWSVRKVPKKVAEEAEFSGYLTIDGYNCSVFEFGDSKQMWAQKSSGTPASDEEIVKIARLVERSTRGSL